MQTNELLDAHEAADYLRVHRVTISRWVRRGLLHPVAQEKRRGQGRQEFTVGELNRFLIEEAGDRWWQQ